MVTQSEKGSHALDRKARRLMAVLELRKLAVDGHSTGEIQQALGLSRRTYYRYLHTAFEPDRRALERQNTNEVMRHIAILAERNNRIYQILKGIAEDPKVSGEDRIVACNDMFKVSKSTVELYRDAPGVPIDFKKRLDDLKQKAANSLMQQQHVEGGRYIFPSTHIFNPNDRSPYTADSMILRPGESPLPPTPTADGTEEKA